MEKFDPTNLPEPHVLTERALRMNPDYQAVVRAAKEMTEGAGFSINQQVKGPSPFPQRQAEVIDLLERNNDLLRELIQKELAKGYPKEQAPVVEVGALLEDGSQSDSCLITR